MRKPRKTSYQAIKAEVLARIRGGIWPPGTLMPGEIELAEEFQCARATVNRAMRELAEEGFIDRKRKSGTRVKEAPTRQAKFVIPQIRKEIESTGKTYRYSLVDREQLTAPGWLRGKLGLPAKTEVLHVQCMHYGDGMPFQYENRWINLAPVPGARDADFEDIGPNEWLINQVPFTDAELTFSASTAIGEVAEFLTIENGSAVFTAERVTWLSSIPVTYAQLFFHPGYQMTTRL